MIALKAVDRSIREAGMAVRPINGKLPETGARTTVFLCFLLVFLLPPPADAAPRCQARAEREWPAAPGQTLRVEAFGEGPACDKVVVVLAIRSASNEVLWTESSDASKLLTFSDPLPKSAADLKGALEQWIVPSSQLDQMADLPDWPEGAGQPIMSEFPFYVEQYLDRQSYIG